MFIFVLHLHCFFFQGLFSSCGDRELLLIVVCGPFTVVASLVVEPGLYGLHALVVAARGL